MPALVRINQYDQVAEVEIELGARKANVTFGKQENGTWRIVAFDEIEMMLAEALTKLEDKCGCGKPLDGSPTGLCDECFLNRDESLRSG
jgi:hypothetical protein